MANCNNTPCGCQDSALTTPCGYTDCSSGNERCEDLQCAECVSYCGTSFQAHFGAYTLQISSGERLDQILQKFALIFTQGLGACTADNLHHAPFNLYAQNITSSSVDVVWAGTSNLSVGYEIYYDTIVNPSGWTLANTSGLIPISMNVYTLTNLAPNTGYKIKIVSEDSGQNVCDSVEILIETLT